MGTNLSVIHPETSTQIDREVEDLAAEVVELKTLVETLQKLSISTKIDIESVQRDGSYGRHYRDAKLVEIRTELAMARTLIASAHRRNLKKRLTR